jgi:hypothetical protein
MILVQYTVRVASHYNHSGPAAKAEASQRAVSDGLNAGVFSFLTNSWFSAGVKQLLPDVAPSTMLQQSTLREYAQYCNLPGEYRCHKLNWLLHQTQGVQSFFCFFFVSLLTLLLARAL